MPTTLVLGGPRSGKTRHAASLLREHDQVSYVATGSSTSIRTEGADPAADEIFGAPKVTRLPPTWESVRTGELTRTLLAARRPVLIDGLTDWVRTHLDAQDLWQDPVRARTTISALLAELVVAAGAVPFPVVLVGQELSTASLPEDPRQRLLVELNAEVNTELSTACSRVHMVVAGRVVDLSDAPVVR